jgi:parvulin-like peptidyl-prolyl isomerase
MTNKYILFLFTLAFAVGLAACNKKPSDKTKTSTAETMDYSLPPGDFETGDQGRPGMRPMPRPPRKLGPEMAGSHILIAYKGARRAKPEVTRTKAEALAFAKKLTAEIKKDPKKFADLAKTHSNGPSGKRGGFLGSWRQGRMVPEFDTAIAKLKINEISTEPVETAFGYHVMKRMPLPPVHAGKHILLAFKGAKRAKPTVTRTKAEALALGKKLAAELKKDPKKFDEYAKKHSDGPAAQKGGSLGKWKKGKTLPAFDTAIEKIKIGEVADPVETPFGIHVMMRVDPKTVPDRPRRGPRRGRRMPQPRRR